MPKHYTKPREMKNLSLWGKKLHNYCKRNSLTIDRLAKIAGMASGTLELSMKIGHKPSSKTKTAIRLAKNQIAQRLTVDQFNQVSQVKETTDEAMYAFVPQLYTMQEAREMIENEAVVTVGMKLVRIEKIVKYSTRIVFEE